MGADDDAATLTAVFTGTDGVELGRATIGGRLGGRALSTGRYRLTVTARPAGPTGGPATTAHRTVRVVA